MPERINWGIHAGRDGEADNLFLDKKVIALGWSEVGDLSIYKDRESFQCQSSVVTINFWTEVNCFLTHILQVTKLYGNIRKQYFPFL